MALPPMQARRVVAASAVLYGKLYVFGSEAGCAAVADHQWQ